MMTIDETEKRIEEIYTAYLSGKPLGSALMALVSIIASLLLNIFRELDELNARAAKQQREMERQTREEKRQR